MDDKIYFTDFQGLIERANFDGSGLETLLTGQFGAEGIALDIEDGKMYWAASGQGSLRRANLNGTGVETLVTGLSDPLGVALQIELAQVPEPPSFAVVLIGLLGFCLMRMRRSRAHCAKLDGKTAQKAAA